MEPPVSHSSSQHPPPAKRESIARNKAVQLLAYAFFITLLLLTKRDIGYYGLLVFAAMATGIAIYLFKQYRILREIAFFSSVKDHSWLQWFRRRYFFLRIFTLIIGGVLTLSASVYLTTIQLPVLIILAVPVFFFPQFRWFFEAFLRLQLKSLSLNFISNAFAVLTVASLTLLLMIGLKYLELVAVVDQSVLLSSDSVATYVIEKVSHGVPLIQHLGRTLAMFELELLRARELSDGILGDIILLYFLLPSTLTAFAITYFYAGIYRLLSRQRRPTPKPLKL